MSLSAAGPRAPDLSGLALDDRYELHRLLGEGTFGRVYRGRDRRLARPVAVKVIKPWWSEDPEWVRRFEREAQLMARVSDSRIVQIFDVGRAPEGLYYVAEVVAGESLDARLRGGALALAAAREIAEQLSHALGSAHAERIVHGDVKPANVLISSAGTVKVTDFGLARLLGGPGAQMSSTVAGTPTYMAPEQARGRTTAASDVYSAGVVLYEMLSGRPPFQGDTPVELAIQHLQDPPPPLPGEVPSRLAVVVERALAKDPGQRYADGAELAEALAEAGARTRAGSSPREESGPAPRRVARTLLAAPWSRRRNIDPGARRRTVAAFAVVLLVLAGLLVTAWQTTARRVATPPLSGLTAAAARLELRHAGLRVNLTRSYSSRIPAGRVISQRPVSGSRVETGSRVSATLSRGPAPVPLPSVLGFSWSDAENALRQLGLQVKLNRVPGFGRTPGTVTREHPSAPHELVPGSPVTLSVAEAPRWRDVLSFTGGVSPSFRIRGARWRVVYRMSYAGTCTFIFFCSGPTARVSNASTGATIASFGLGSGSGQTQTFSSGPGTYAIKISPGQDTSQWAVEVQDYF